MSLQGLEALRRGLEAAPEMVQHELLVSMTTVMSHLDGEVVDAMSPMSVSGLTRASVVSEAYTTPLGALGVVGSASVAAAVLEDGRAAGKPVSKEGQAAIAQWAMQKLGLGAKEAPGVAYLIARKITARGLPAKQPFRKTYDANLGMITQEFERCAERISTHLAAQAGGTA